MDLYCETMEINKSTWWSGPTMKPNVSNSLKCYWMPPITCRGHWKPSILSLGILNINLDFHLGRLQHPIKQQHLVDLVLAWPPPKKPGFENDGVFDWSQPTSAESSNDQFQKQVDHRMGGGRMGGEWEPKSRKP